MQILTIGIAHALFMVFYYIVKKPYRLANKIIALFMFFLAASLFSKLILVKYMMLGLKLNQTFFVLSFAFTFGPFLFLYTRVMISENPRFNSTDLLHFVPFIISISVGLLALQLPLIKNSNYYILYYTLLIISLVMYTMKVFLIIKKHDMNIDNYFSNISGELDLHWIKWITLFFTIAFSFIIIASIRQYNIGSVSLYNIDMVKWIGIAFFILSFSFFVLPQNEIYQTVNNKKNPEIKKNNIDKSGQHKEVEEKLHRYQRSGLKENDAERYVLQLEEYMKKEEPYLNGDLTIIHLSEELQISRHYLTQILNEKLNKNFYTYINEYRIQYVIKKMKDKTFEHHTILRIAFDSGFNSKSVFNTMFKKFTTMSPSEFRRNIQKVMHNDK